MKHISNKMIAAALTAMIILSCSAPAVGAAKVNSRAQIKLLCNNGSCGSVEKLLKQYCKNRNCNLNELIKSIGGFCPDGNCSTKKPNNSVQQHVKKPSESVVSTNTNSAEFNTAYESEVFRLVNVEREKYGLSPLIQDNGTTKVARLRAKEIVKSFSHTRPDGSTCFTAANELGVSYRLAGENIAYGYPTPQKVVNGWMNSEGHRKNILSFSFKKVGIGCYKSNGVLYWTQFFTN